MMRFIFIILLAVLGTKTMAQDADTLRAYRKDGAWIMKYTMKPGESVRMLALRFSLSEGQLLNANEAETIKKLAPGSEIIIPVTKDNFYIVKQPLANLKELYYKIAAKDDISIISTYSGVTKNQMREWNSLKGNTLLPGQDLLVGWVKMIPKDTANPATLIAYPSKRKKMVADTAKIPVPGGLDTVFNRQTSFGLNVLTEKGSAVFFEKAGNKSSVLLAFHNTAKRGTIIKVTNPGNGRSIFARVLGTLPNTKQYSGSIIGISDAAKEALGVNDNKAWCELSYSPE